MQRRAVFLVGDGLADEHVLEAAQADDIALAGVLELDLFHALVAEERRDLAALAPTVAVRDDHGVVHADTPREDAPVGDPAQVVTVIQVGNKHLEVARSRAGRRRDLLDDLVEERGHVLALVGDLLDRVAGLGTGVDRREIELLVAGA